jgi:hypothetical protein
MSFEGMSRSINPMCSPEGAPGPAWCGFAPECLIVLMSLRPAIPRRVALLHCSLPLHRAIAMMNEGVGTVNHHSLGAGEFSVGEMGKFQLALTEGWHLDLKRLGTPSTAPLLTPADEV